MKSTKVKLYENEILIDTISCDLPIKLGDIIHIDSQKKDYFAIRISWDVQNNAKKIDIEEVEDKNYSKSIGSETFSSEFKRIQDQTHFVEQLERMMIIEIDKVTPPKGCKEDRFSEVLKRLHGNTVFCDLLYEIQEKTDRRAFTQETLFDLISRAEFFKDKRNGDLLYPFDKKLKDTADYNQIVVNGLRTKRKKKKNKSNE